MIDPQAHDERAEPAPPLAAGARRCARFGALPWSGQVTAWGLLALFAGLAVLLWPNWVNDPDLSHGFFVPILSAFLVVESRRTAEGYFGRRSGVSVALWALVSLAALLIAGVYAAVLDWSHSLVVGLITFSACALAVAGWLALSDERLGWIPRNWPSLASILLWPLASPLPPGTYARLSRAFQGSVTSVVMDSLHVAGIAAYREGNVIELAKATVGVSEACSGVRSLISSLAAALFFSGLVATRTRSRVILLVAGPAIALFMNYLRSLILTVVASTGVDIEGAWHDLTGTAIIVVTSGCLLALALTLDRRHPARVRAGEAVASGSFGGPAKTVLAGLVGFALASAGFAVATHPLATTRPRPLDLHALLPAPPPGWALYPGDDLTQYEGILHTNILAQQTYLRKDGDHVDVISIYLAYWLPGQAPVSLVASHTPDACWPGTGWEPVSVPQRHLPLPIDGRVLPEAEYRIFANNGFRDNVWFWHVYGGRPLAYEDPYAFSRLFGLALHFGFQHNRDQLFVRISSNRPWSEIASTPILEQFCSSVRPLGL